MARADAEVKTTIRNVDEKTTKGSLMTGQNRQITNNRARAKSVFYKLILLYNITNTVAFFLLNCSFNVRFEGNKKP